MLNLRTTFSSNGNEANQVHRFFLSQYQFARSLPSKMVEWLKVLITLQWFLTTKCTQTLDVKIGLLMPQDEVDFVKYMYGFSTSAGAVTLALDRVIDEQLLPKANFR